MAGETVDIDDSPLFKHKFNIADIIDINDNVTFKRLINLIDNIPIKDSLLSNIVFQLQSDSYSIIFPMPEYGGESGSVNNELKLFNFWLEDRETNIIGISDEPITLSGKIYAYGNNKDVEMATIVAKFLNMHAIMDKHESVTITGLGTCFDATYIIKNFSYSTIRGSPYAFTWNLTLEYVRD